jgi:TetR/AcrR family transcriptional regulator, repressor for uid operon
MNIHSHEVPMSTATLPETASKADQRRGMILEAATQVFLRRGFDAATMHDVASAAGMSAGNIYRYFASKSAIIVELVECDRSELADKFSRLARSPDILGDFELHAREHFNTDVISHAPLTVEIWAAARRNPELAAVCRSFEREISDMLLTLFGMAKEAGQIAPQVDINFLLDLMMTLADGVIRYATYDPDRAARHVDIMFATLRAAFAGRIDPLPVN